MKELKVHLDINGSPRCLSKSNMMTIIKKDVTCGKCLRMMSGAHRQGITNIMAIAAAKK